LSECKYGQANALRAGLTVTTRLSITILYALQTTGVDLDGGDWQNSA